MSLRHSPFSYLQDGLSHPAHKQAEIKIIVLPDAWQNVDLLQSESLNDYPNDKLFLRMYFISCF